LSTFDGFSGAIRTQAVVRGATADIFAVFCPQNDPLTWQMVEI